MNLKPEYDEESDSLYFKVSSKHVYSTIEISPRLGLDVSSDRKVVGVEMLDASRAISDLFQKAVPKEKIKKLLCEIRQEDALYLDMRLEGRRASLALPQPYESPVLRG